MSVVLMKSLPLGRVPQLDGSTHYVRRGVYYV